MGSKGKTWKQKPETIAKRVAKLKGKKRTQEQKDRISKSHLGQKAWNKGITGEKSHFFGRKLSEKHKESIRNRTSGEKNHFWKGGVSPVNERIRKTSQYKLWRIAVFQRDNYTCVFCLARGGKLHADHIKPFAYYPELRFAIDNGRTLCEKCHHQTDTYGSKAQKFKNK